VWLIVGLGNPGQKYYFTRHNLGFRVIDHLSGELSIPLNNELSLLAEWGKGDWNNHKLILAKPQTFMNLSGEAVFRLKKFFRIETKKMIVIHDDLDLKFGQIKIRDKGGDAGHKGIKSIIESLGEEEFIRIRMGIGRPQNGLKSQDYVLADFDEVQKRDLALFVDQAKEAVIIIIKEGIDRAMNRFNRRL